MKCYNRQTSVLADFNSNGEVNPAFFVCASGTRAKVNRVIRRDEIRWGFRPCIRYFIEFDGKLAELYWDKHRDMWFLIKEGR